MKSVVMKSVAVAMSLGVLGGVAHAQDYPDRNQTLTIVVSFPPGGASDAIMRTLGEKFREEWGINTVVENRPGGELMVAANAIASAPKTGYTMGLMTGDMVLNQIIYPNQQVNPFKAFTPVGLIATTANVLVVPANSPIKSFKDLQDASKRNPNALNYSSCCASIRFAAEMLKKHTGVAGAHIPFKGSAPSVQATAAGQTDWTLDTGLSTKPLIEGGRLRALAVTTRERQSFLPDVPGLAEIGVSGGFELVGWFSMVMPAGTPPGVVATANRTLNKILAMPDVQKRLSGFYVKPAGGAPEAVTALMNSDFERYSRLAKESNLKFD